MAPHMFQEQTVLGSGNKGKIAEITRYASSLGLSLISLDSPSLKSHGAPPYVAETSLTYAGNAELKAVAYSRWSQCACIADDTGLEIEALGALPGLYTARWGLERVSREVAPFSEVAARFVCAMAYADPVGRVVSVTKSVEGKLRGLGAGGQRGNHPLPFSKFFYPVGSQQSLEELIPKGYLGSHRAQALTALLGALR